MLDSQARVPGETYYENCRDDLIALLPDRSFGRILEIGGGAWPTLRKLCDLHGAAGVGIDTYGEEAPGLEIHTASFEDRAAVDKLGRDFDLVIAGDVFEHLRDPRDSFGFAADLLAPGGILVVSVPNVRFLRLAKEIYFRGTFPRADFGFWDRTHLQWFTKHDVASFAEGAGLEILDILCDGPKCPGWSKRNLVGELLSLHVKLVARKPA